MGGENGEGLRAHLGSIKDRINVPASLVATGLSALAMNAAIYIPGWGDDTLPGTLRDAGTVENTTTTKEIIGRSTHTFRKHTVKERPVDSVSGKTEFELQSGAQVYAEQFAEDPDAGEFSDPKSLDKVVDGISRLVKSGAEITSVTITGYSSAEDDKPDGGFTEPSQKNRGLAEKRADSVADDLSQRTSDNPELEKALRGIDIKFGEPVEQSLDPAEQKSLNHAAKLSGFSSAKQLVKAWNDDPSSVGPENIKLLDNLLGSHRKVTADIGWRRAGKDIYSVDDFCTRFIITSLKTQEHKDDDQIPVIPYFLPILIPRRRKKTGSSPDSPDPYAAEFSPRLKDAAEGRISADEYLGRPAAVDGVPAGRSRARSAPPVSSKTPGRTSLGDSRAEKIVRRAINGTLIGAFGLIACINVTGRDCDGDVHVPRPWLIDAVWDAIDGNPDQAQKYSLGVPFVDSLQLFQSKNWEFPTVSLTDPRNVCEKDGSSMPGAPAPVPKCAVIRITKEDGTVISRQVVVPAGPYKTHTVIEKTR